MLKRRVMKPCRSALFVPGNKPDWVEKAVASGVDSLIIDLEDSVPVAEKKSARLLVKEALIALNDQGQDCSVRVNGFATGMMLDDLESIVCPALKAVALPKVETVEDMEELDALLTRLEERAGIEPGSVKTGLGLETAKAMRNAYDIVVACPRVTSLVLAAGPGGDASRAVGYLWSREGTETLYLRSKAVLDAQAAGIRFPMITSWWNVSDLEGLERDARFNRQLGFRGQTVIHPSHVPVVNEVFTPSGNEIAYYKGMLAAMEEAQASGTAAVVYQGNMVDYAMAETAREMLAFAESIGLTI
jgi:citrate lyase subunit beta/citryl-CoA lyase